MCDITEKSALSDSSAMPQNDIFCFATASFHLFKSIYSVDQRDATTEHDDYFQKNFVTAFLSKWNSMRSTITIKTYDHHGISAERKPNIRISPTQNISPIGATVPKIPPSIHHQPKFVMCVSFRITNKSIPIPLSVTK